jgi:hypothetical protein
MDKDDNIKELERIIRNKKTDIEKSKSKLKTTPEQRNKRISLHEEMSCEDLAELSYRQFHCDSISCADGTIGDKMTLKVSKQLKKECPNVMDDIETTAHIKWQEEHLEYDEKELKKLKSKK